MAFSIDEVADSLQRYIGYALNDQGFQRDLAEEGEALWFLYTVAHADLGQYQLPEICEQLGYAYPSDECYEEWVDTDSFDEELNTRLDTPDYCQVYLGYWPEGGCFGIILQCNKES